MEIYDALESRITPQQIVEKEKERQNQEFVDNLFTPTDKVSIENKYAELENKYLDTENKYINSEITSNFLAQEQNRQITAKRLEINENFSPSFEISEGQFDTIAKFVSNTDNVDDIKNKLEPALLFSNVLNLPLETTLANLDQISEQYGLGRWTNNASFGEYVKNNFMIGNVSMKRAELANQLIDLADQLSTSKDEENSSKIQEQIDGIREQISEYDDFIMKHTAYMDQGMIRTLVGGVAQNIPYIFETVKAGAKAGIAMGSAIALVSATGGVGFLPAFGIGAAGITAAQTSAIAAAASVSTYLKVKDITKGQKYLDFIDNGVDHQTAKIASDIFGSVAGFEEVMLDALPMQFINTALGKEAGITVINKAFQKLALTGSFGGLIKTLGNAVTGGAGEALTEAAQSISETITDNLVASYEETGNISITDALSKLSKDDLKQAGEEAAMGFGVAMLLGSPAYYAQTKMNISDYKNIEKIALSSDSKQHAVNEAKKISPDTDVDVLGEVIDKIREKNTPIVGETKTTPIGGDIEIKATPTKTETITFSKDHVSLIGTKRLKTTDILNSNGDYIGVITKLENGNAVTITNINIDDNYNIDVEDVVRQFIQENLGKDIDWDTNNNPEYEIIKENLIAENPRGEKYGLSWLKLNQSEADLANIIKKPFNLTTEQSSIMAKMFELEANAQGKTGIEYWNDKVKALKVDDLGSARGKIEFNVDKNQVKAVIYTAKNSDVTTFTHETFHLITQGMNNRDELANRIKNWVDTDEENFIAYVKENQTLFDTNLETTLNTAKNFSLNSKNWSQRENELAASLFEAWFVGGKTNNAALNSLMSKISEWFREVYKTIKQTVKINDEVADFFDNMFSEEIKEVETTEEFMKRIDREMAEFDERLRIKKEKVENDIREHRNELLKKEQERINKEFAKKIKEIRKRSKQLDAENEKLKKEAEAREKAKAKAKESDKSVYSRRDEGPAGIRADIKYVFDLSDEEADLAMNIIKARAKKEGYSVVQWWDRNVFQIKKIITDTPENVGFLAEILYDVNDPNIVENGANVILSVLSGTGIDLIGTFLHEIFHISILTDPNKTQLANSIKDWVVNDREDFEKFYDEHEVAYFNNIYRKYTKERVIAAGESFDETKEWTHDQHELAVMLYEIWLTEEGLKKKTVNSWFKKITQKMIEFFGVFLGNTKLKKDISDFFNNMYDVSEDGEVLYQQNLDQEYINAVESGNIERATELFEAEKQKAIEKGIDILPDDTESVAFKYHRGEAPKKTKTVYAVFNVKNGLRAAFAGTENEIPVGIWLDAQAIDGIPSTTKKFPDGTPKKYIPGATGLSAKEVGIDPVKYGLPKGQKFLFFRPGKHASDIPNFSQMNVKDIETGERQAAMPHDKIIFEIEVGADVDLTEQMLEEAPKHPKTGKPMMREAGLQRIPKENGKEGFYNYKTNPNAKGNWIIASSFKINRLVPYSEIKSINEELGLKVPKWNGGYTPEEFGITDEYMNAEKNKIRKLADPIVYDSNGNVIPLSERFSEDPNVLYQSENREQVDARATEEAMIFRDLETFKTQYDLLHPNENHFDWWYEKIFNAGKTKAGLLDVEDLYTRLNTNEKNIVFKNSLDSSDLSKDFISKIREFKKHFESLKGEQTKTPEYEVKKSLFEDIENIMPEEILGTKRITEKMIINLQDLAEENSSPIRVIFAKLYGLDYMMDDTEFSNEDYFSTYVQNYDETNSTLVDAILSSTDNQARLIMRNNYKKAKADLDAQVKNLKESVESLKKQRDEAIEKVKNNAAEIKRIKEEYQNKLAKVRQDYRDKINKIKDVQRAEKLVANIKKKPSTSVRFDYAQDIYAIQAIVDKTIRNKFKRSTGETWTPEMAYQIIDRNLGAMYSNLFTPEFIKQNIENDSFTTTDLEILKALVDILRSEGIKRRNRDRQVLKDRIQNTTESLINTANATYQQYKKGKMHNFLKKLPFGDELSYRIFSSTYNMDRKAKFLDGVLAGNKNGAFYELLIERKNDLKNQEFRTVDRRLSKITDIMKKHDISVFDLSETALTTKFDGIEQKHSYADLGYYWYSQFNEDNLKAVAGGHLMTAEERLDSNLNLDEFTQKAYERYSFVLDKARELIDNDIRYKELFEAIYSEFNGDTINKMNELMLRVKNEQVSAINKYLPIQRIDSDIPELLTAFAIDVDGRTSNNKIGTTKYKNLLERQKIALRNQSDINTNIFDLLLKTVQNQEHLLANYEYVYELRNIFTGYNSKKLRETISNYFSDDIYKDIITEIEEIANPYINYSDSHLSRAVRMLRGNLYPAYLAARLPVIKTQIITSPAAFFGKMNLLEYLPVLANTMFFPRKRRMLMDNVNELSPFMKNRSWDYIWAEWKKIRKDEGKVSNIFLKYQHILDIMMSGLQWADTTTVYSGWYVLYNKELEKLGGYTKENQAKAVKAADDFVRITQPHSDVTEIAPIFKSEHAAKIFTQFTASLSPIYQNLTFDLIADFKQKKYGEALGMVFGYSMVGAILFASQGGYDEDDDREETIRKFIFSLLTQPTSSLPLIGSSVEWAFQRVITGEQTGLYSTNKFPSFDKFIYSVGKFAKGDYNKAIDGFTDAILIALGLPYGLKNDIQKSFEGNSLLPLFGYEK